MAWLTGWNYRNKLTIDHTLVDADCSDFPFKVILDGDNFDFSKALSTGNDIRFTSSDGETLLKYERELHQFSTTEWDGFQGLVEGYSSFDISNANYIAVTSSRRGLMHKYARLATSIDASGDFAFQFGLYLASYSFNTFGSLTNIGLDASGDGYYTGVGYGNEEYLGIAVAYDTDINAKPYVYGIFENTIDYTTGYALNSTTQYIIKLSKTGTTLKTAVCSSDGTELWSNTATASTTPTLSYYKVVNRYLIDASSSYWTYRLSDFYNGATEDTLSLRRAVYHVKVPTASSTSNTDVYMYYGKADATDGADGENVWDSNYKMVLHMDSALLDSTANDNDGTNTGTVLGTARDGYNRTLAGNHTQYITVADDATLRVQATTVEAYIKPSAISKWSHIIDKGHDLDQNYGFRFTVTYANYLRFRYRDTGNTLRAVVSEATIANNTLQHVAGTFDATNLKAYIDGALSKSENLPYTVKHNDAPMYVGFPLNTSSAQALQGSVYEVRISSSARSAAWIKATHASLADTLLTYGSLENAPSVGTPRVMVVWA